MNCSCLTVKKIPTTIGSCPMHTEIKNTMDNKFFRSVNPTPHGYKISTHFTLHIFYSEAKQIKYDARSMGYTPAIVRKYFLKLFFQKRACLKIQNKKLPLILFSAIVRRFASNGNIVWMPFYNTGGSYFYKFSLLEIFNGLCAAIPHSGLQATS
jgi:hypothetical protein